VIALHPDVERLALLGWRLHPVSRWSRAACIKDAADRATSDLDQLARWANDFPGCGWRVVMEGSGIWALDIDVPSADHAADGMKALVELVAMHGSLPPRPTTRSGGGGLALFFQHNGEAISGRTGTPVPGLDPRRGALAVTVPPSIHPRTGRSYRWIVAPWDLTPPPAPAWLLRLVAPPPAPAMSDVPKRLQDGGSTPRRYAVAALRRAVERVATARQGTRNDALNQQAFAMARFIRDNALDPSEVALALTCAAREAGLHPPEIEQTLASALRAGRGRP